MISFRTKAEATTSIAIILALLVLVTTGIFMAFIKKPSNEGIATGKIRSQRELEDRIAKLEAEEIAARTTIESWVWKEPIADIGPKALANVTSYSQRNRLKLIAFRPQKTVEVNELTQIPFVISIEGAYPNILQFVRDLETPSLKLGTGMVQVSTSDSNSDLVSATISVVAYRKPEPKKTRDKPDATKKEN